MWEPEVEDQFLIPRISYWYERLREEQELKADKLAWDQNVSPGEIRAGWWIRTPSDYHGSYRALDFKTLLCDCTPRAYLFRNGTKVVLYGEPLYTTEAEQVLAEYNEYWDLRLKQAKDRL